MPANEVILSTKLSLVSWQYLVSMAAEDVREPENFIQWLVIREAARRGLLPADPAPAPAGEGVAHAAEPA